MRHFEFIVEAKGVFGRKNGDKFENINGASAEFVEVLTFPGVDEGGQFTTIENRDEHIAEFQIANQTEIEWVNASNKSMLGYAIAVLNDTDGNLILWGRYMKEITHNMLGKWPNKGVPSGWSLATKSSRKLQAGYDPQNLIKVETVFKRIPDVIKTVQHNAPDEVSDVLTTALSNLYGGNSTVEFPGMWDQQEALRDYFGEIMQPIALMGKVIGGQAEDARKLLADGVEWDQCSVHWPMSANAALCDSYVHAPNGQEIGISSKGGSGANASAKNLYDAYENARKTGNQELIDSAKYTIDVVKIINNYSAKDGPIMLGRKFKLPGFSARLQKEVDEYIKLGRVDFGGISPEAKTLLEPYNVKTDTIGFNVGFAILSAAAKTVAAYINTIPEFSKGALALLNQASIIQIYTKMGKRGDNAVIADFNAVYPPKFQGSIQLDGGKNYYSSRIGGKIAFKFAK